MTHRPENQSFCESIFPVIHILDSKIRRMALENFLLKFMAEQESFFNGLKHFFLFSEG